MSLTSGRGHLPWQFPRAAQFAWIWRQKKVRLVALAVLLLIPTLFILVELLQGLMLYKQLSNQMQDGVNHLQAAVHVFESKTNDGVAGYFDTGRLSQAQQEMALAHVDFALMSQELDQNDLLSLVSPLWPTQIQSARALAHIATDGTTAAQQVLKTMGEIAPTILLTLQNSPASTAPAPLQPFLTPTSYQEITTTLNTLAPLVHRMASAAQGISLDSLPISSKQRELMASMLPLLPVLDTVLQQQSKFQEPLRWLLGIDHQRDFLIEPMDSAELRATGGFTGQFGDLLVNGAHTGPVKLANIGLYEEDLTYEGSPPDPTVYPKVQGQQAPAPYSNWWPIPNFGMRDANVSADFPTSARIVMDRYRYEFGRTVDGVLMFTPAFIQQVLDVTGPIAIPAYKQIVTAQNLEDLLHYYQLNNAGITQEEVVEHVNDSQVARKLFTQRVTTALIETVMQLPLNKMFSLANEMLQSMKSKDLEIYVTNAQVESLIGIYGSTASLDRSTTHDGLYIVQSNLSANKASQYVTTSIQDTITLDQRGGATHTLHMTLAYQQTGDVYGLDTYRDYVRVYVPENSQFLSGNGFEQYDRPYCGDAQSGYRLCQPNVYGNGSLICSAPIEIGFAASYLDDPYAGTDHPLDRIGPPQNQQSDEAGRAMFGGWVVIPKNCTMKVSLSWYVPPLSEQPYRLLVQAQAGITFSLELTIESAIDGCAPHQGDRQHFSQVMSGVDRSFSFNNQC